MKAISLVLFAASLFQASFQSKCSLSCTQKYTVLPGDGFFAIGTKFNLNFHDIEKCNPKEAKAGLQPKEVIHLPVFPTSAKCPTKYKLQVNDTFSSVSQKNGLDLQAVVDCNPCQDAKLLQIGQEILLPPKKSHTPPSPSPSKGSSGNTPAYQQHNVAPGPMVPGSQPAYTQVSPAGSGQSNDDGCE